MNLYPSTTTLRDFIAYEFSTLRARARRSQLWAKLVGAKATLAVFPRKDARLTPSRELIGIQNIRVDQIVGTLNRDTDFDHLFRPLNKHSLDRWVNAYILQARDGWAPILVHKVDEQYFVEDGHHRVSVARMTGMDFIESKVWEHGAQKKNTDACQPAIYCTKKSSAKGYATH